MYVLFVGSGSCVVVHVVVVGGCCGACVRGRLWVVDPLYSTNSHVCRKIRPIG